LTFPLHFCYLAGLAQKTFSVRAGRLDVRTSAAAVSVAVAAAAVVAMPRYLMEVLHLAPGRQGQSSAPASAGNLSGMLTALTNKNSRGTYVCETQLWGAMGTDCEKI
jgi:hypothetical protein